MIDQLNDLTRSLASIIIEKKIKPRSLINWLNRIA